MKLSYKQIEYIEQVARGGSVTAACRSMSISPSSILAAIDCAEAITGVKLFVRRKGHGIELTPAGQKFLVGARRFLAAGEEFYKSLDTFPDLKGSVIRIGCFASLGALILPPVLQRFLFHSPSCEVTLYEGNQSQLREWLRDGVVDLVVTYDIGEEFGSSITPICKLPTHALLRNDDPSAQAPSISLSDLAKRPLVLLDLPETRIYLTSLFDITGQRPRIMLRTQTYETVRAAVSSGLGMSVLNVRPVGEISPDSANLSRLPISDQLRQPTLLVADPYGEGKPAYVKSFISHLYQFFADIGPDKFAICLPQYSDGLLCDPPSWQVR